MQTELTCPTCGRKFSRWPSQIKGKQTYCSRECIRGYTFSKPGPPPKPPIDNGDGTYLIPLTRGKFATIDAEDLPLVAGHHWQARPSRHTWYASRAATKAEGGQGLVLMHRVILEAKADELGDHRDGDGLNNRRSNLRTCAHPQNARNRRVTDGRPKGVYPTPSGKFIARVTANRKTVNLGTYATAAEATKAYDTAAHRLHGEFARINQETSL